MSKEARDWAWGVDTPGKVVLLFLAELHNAETRCFPSVSTIARQCSISTDTAKRYLSLLETQGLLTRHDRFIKGRQTSNEYVLNLEWMGGAKCGGGGGQNAGGEGVQNTPTSNRLTSNRKQHLSGVEGAVRRKHMEKDLRQRVKSKLLAPAKIPNTLKPIIDKWSEIAIAHGESTKALHNGLRVLRQVLKGDFFKDKNGWLERAARDKRFVSEQILQAFEVFDKMRNDLEYLPTDKKFIKKISLAEFFWSVFVVNGEGPGGGSLFLRCLGKNGLKLAGDIDPVMTQYVRTKYLDLKGESLDELGAYRASNKFVKYWKENKEWLKGKNIRTDRHLVVAWFEMLEARYGGEWDLGNVLGQGMNAVFKKHMRRN